KYFRFYRQLHGQVTRVVHVSLQFSTGSECYLLDVSTVSISDYSNPWFVYRQQISENKQYS
ncbi:MAG: hypothetical protein ACTHT9_07545, partial [Idiomarina loihiensis]